MPCIVLVGGLCPCATSTSSRPLTASFGLRLDTVVHNHTHSYLLPTLLMNATIPTTPDASLD